ncbi:MAG: DNA polymerase [Bacilli bacterium]
MTSSAKSLSIDIETYSSIDLNNCGVYKYVEANDFEVLLFGYSVDGGVTRVVDLASGETIPPEIIALLKDESVTKWAFNASFERICLSKFLGLPPGKYLNPRAWKCTMVWSAYLGLPLSLKSVAEALKLTVQKLDEGKELIKLFCTPPKQAKPRQYYYHDPIKWTKFKKYNIRDVDVELAIKDRLKNYPVPDFVWEEYFLDQAINDQGVLVDLDFVQKCIEINDESSKELEIAMKNLTEVDNPNSVSQIKTWLIKRGVDLGDLGKKSVEKIKQDYVDDPVGEAMALRQMLSKTSTKKYMRMVESACSDKRIRGMFSFYGANRTGRFSSRIVQLQNLPQNHLKDIEIARDLIKNRDLNALKMLYEDVPDTLSQLIRTAFIPKPGHKFIVADFSSIEARVIAWLAKEKWRVDAFARNEDIYCASAARMFNVPVVKNGINGHLRQKGKIAELALGYGGSKEALTKMGALDMGLVEDELPGLVSSWRKANTNITKLWWDIDKAVKKVITDGGSLRLYGLTLTHRSGMLFIKLPSGRELAYVMPRIGLNKFRSECVTYYGSTPQTKKWDRTDSYGPKFVENIVQGIARDVLCHSLSLMKDLKIVMHIHDEIVVEVPGAVSVESITNIMSTSPSWAKGLYLKADGYECKFYMKK